MVVASRQLGLNARTWRIRLAVAGCVALVFIGLGFIVLRPRSYLTPAVVVSLNQSNGPVRVFSSSGGVVLVLPDGSLWRWGNAGAAAFSVARVPEQVGTNQDWVEAAAGYPHLVALRRDGTLWEWGRHGGSSGEPSDLGTQPSQVDSSHDWVGVSATANRSVALRRDGTLWSWGENAMGPSGVGTGPRNTRPTQVGTNNDWAAVCCSWNCALALRRDGTLWTWGQVPIVGAGWVNMTDLPSPTPMCLESNWTGFAGGFLSLVWNRSGELWEPFHAAPDPEVPAAANSRLVLAHGVPGRVATAWCGEPEIYEVRPDGTLWGRTQPLSSLTATPVGEWRRLGKRSDWTALWGAGGTALGLTADGTLWTWGIDPGGQSAPDLVSRLKLAQSRLMSLFGPGPRPIPPNATPAYRKQPRPLMKMVLTRSGPPAKGNEGGGR